MPTVIVYPTRNGGVAVCTPVPNCGLTLEQVALKDVPVGVPFKYVDTSEIPTDPLFRDAWELTVFEPDGYGADYGLGSKNVVMAWANDGSPVIEHRPDEPTYFD